MVKLVATTGSDAMNFYVQKLAENLEVPKLVYQTKVYTFDIACLRLYTTNHYSRRLQGD